MDESYRPLLQLFKIRGTSPESLELIGIGFFIGMLLLAGFLVGRRLLRSQRQRREDRQWFHRMAGMKQLSSRHIALLADIARRRRLKRWTPLLTSVRTFDSSIEHYLSQIHTSSDEASGLITSLQELRQALHFTYTGLDQLLHSTRTIAPGQGVSVRLHAGDRRRLLRGLITAVDDTGLTIDLQGRFAAANLLMEGQMIKLAFLRAGDAEYQCETTLQKIVSRNPVVLHTAHSSRLFRRQRRMFFRIHVHLEAMVWILSEQQREEFDATGRTVVPADAVPLHGHAISLSGSGAALLLPHPVARRSYLSATLILSPDLHLNNVTCRVVRVMRVREMLYRVYVQFLDISHHDRERIVRFAIQEEHTRLAKLMERREG